MIKGIPYWSKTPTLTILNISWFCLCKNSALLIKVLLHTLFFFFLSGWIVEKKQQNWTFQRYKTVILFLCDGSSYFTGLFILWQREQCRQVEIPLDLPFLTNTILIFPPHLTIIIGPFTKGWVCWAPPAAIKLKGSLIFCFCFFSDDPSDSLITREVSECLMRFLLHFDDIVLVYFNHRYLWPFFV